MDFTHEIVEANIGIPVQLFHYKYTKKPIEVIPKHWHSTIEILYVVDGRMDVFINSSKYELAKGDLLVINLNEIHSTRNLSMNDVILIQIPYELLKKHYDDIDNLTFNCNSTLQEDDNVIFQRLISMLMDLDNVYSKQQYGYIFKFYSILFEIIFELVNNFSEYKVESNYINSKKYLDRLTKITEYIKVNQKTNLSLEMVAEEFNLTPQYLSKYFKRYMGISYIKYLSSLRLESAYKDLLNTDSSITYIAIENGFPDSKAFSKTFKEVFKINPREYRKKLNSAGYKITTN